MKKLTNKEIVSIENQKEIFKSAKISNSQKERLLKIKEKLQIELDAIDEIINTKLSESDEVEQNIDDYNLEINAIEYTLKHLNIEHGFKRLYMLNDSYIMHILGIETQFE